MDATSDTATVLPEMSPTAGAGEADIQIETPEFAPVASDPQMKPGPDLARFHEVQVSVSAELGRTKMSHDVSGVIAVGSPRSIRCGD